MKEMTKRLLTLTAAAALVITQVIPSFAMDGEMPPPPPDGGGSGAAGQEFATFEEVRSYAGLDMANGVEYSHISDAVAPFNGDVSFAKEGIFSRNQISGLFMDGKQRSSGIAVSMPSENDVFTIGGEESFYTENGRDYNTVIKVNAGDVNSDAGYEAVCGVGAAIETGELHIENSYIYSEGPRSTPVYAFSTASPAATALVVLNSTLEAHSDEIWMPPFKLLSGGARASLLMTRNNSWFYGSQVISNNWGAISQDSVDAMTYVVNSSGTSTQGGYGTYLTYGMRLYGSELYGGQYGIFMCGTSDIVTDTGKAALEDADAMEKAPDFPVDETRISQVAAPFNAVVVHNSLPDITMVAKGAFKNSLISTRPEDLPETVTPMAHDDEFFMPGVDIIGSGNGCGAAYFFNKNLYGSLALIRSMNADFTFDNSETHTANGVLLQSVVTYDPPSASGYLTPEQGETVPGIAGTFLNGSYEGDILHQDYQRAMTVTIGENATLTGKAVSGTYAGWNNLWSEESLTNMLEEDGYTPDFFGNDLWAQDVQANLIRSEDTVYEGTENLGIDMTVGNGGTWIVTGDCSLSSLTLEDGGAITTPEGCTLSFFAGCDSSNSNVFYDETAGEEVTELIPGTYENVVIRLSGEPVVIEETEALSAVEETLTEDSSAVEEPAQIPTDETGSVPEEEAPVPQTDSQDPVYPILLIAAAVAVAMALVVVFSRKKK